MLLMVFIVLIVHDKQGGTPHPRAQIGNTGSKSYIISRKTRTNPSTSASVVSNDVIHLTSDMSSFQT